MELVLVVGLLVVLGLLVVVDAPVVVVGGEVEVVVEVAAPIGTRLTTTGVKTENSPAAT